VLNLKRNIDDRVEAEAAGRTVEGVR
jgi:hypothetical protein